MSFIGGQIPSGVIFDYAGPTAPQGYLLCFGQVVSRTTYAALFAVLGTQYGAGDGSSTFGLPDLRGRSVSGKDDMGGSAANRVTAGISGIAGSTLGAVGGSEAMHAHTHALSGTAAAQAWSGSVGNTNIDHSHNAANIGNPTDTAQVVAFSTVAGSYNPGTTGGMNSNAVHNHSVSGSNSASSVTGTATSTGAGASQNMIPTIILNKIIKV